MLEFEIKKALGRHLNRLTGCDSNPQIIEELRLNGGATIADLVEISQMHCYEIKSHKDSLRRLVGQGARYIRVFDRITLVTDPKHVTLAISLIPDWWGIMLVPEDSKQDFITLRATTVNTMQIPTTYKSFIFCYIK